MLIRRDTTFNSAQIGWLEGRLHNLVLAADDARLHNGNRPSDETLPPYDRQMLERVVLPVTRLLRLIGHDPATAGDTGESGLWAPLARRPSRFYGITLRQIIDDGLLQVGAELHSTNGAWPASAIVSEDGELEMAGVDYDTPSAAGYAVKAGPVNGWEFWGVETDVGRVPLATLRAKYLTARTVDSGMNTLDDPVPAP